MDPSRPRYRTIQEREGEPVNRLSDITRMANHHTLALYHAREADKLMAELVDDPGPAPMSITELARWAHVSRPTVYAMAKRGRLALAEDQLPGTGQ